MLIAFGKYPRESINFPESNDLELFLLSYYELKYIFNNLIHFFLVKNTS